MNFGDLMSIHIDTADTWTYNLHSPSCNHLTVLKEMKTELCMQLIWINENTIFKTIQIMYCISYTHNNIYLNSEMIEALICNNVDQMDKNTKNVSVISIK